jgi:hypothetical protein
MLENRDFLDIFEKVRRITSSFGYITRIFAFISLVIYSDTTDDTLLILDTRYY